MNILCTSTDVTAAALWPIFIGLGHGKQQVLKKMDDFFPTKTLFHVTYLTSVKRCIFVIKKQV